MEVTKHMKQKKRYSQNRYNNIRKQNKTRKDSTNATNRNSPLLIKKKKREKPLKFCTMEMFDFYFIEGNIYCCCCCCWQHKHDRM